MANAGLVIELILVEQRLISWLVHFLTMHFPYTYLTFGVVRNGSPSIYERSDVLLNRYT